MRGAAIYSFAVCAMAFETMGIVELVLNFAQNPSRKFDRGLPGTVSSIACIELDEHVKVTCKVSLQPARNGKGILGLCLPDIQYFMRTDGSRETGYHRSYVVFGDSGCNNSDFVAMIDSRLSQES